MPSIMRSGNEIRFYDARILHELLDAAGVENTFRVYEGAFHTFQLTPCPEAFASIHELGEFLKA